MYTLVRSSRLAALLRCEGALVVARATAQAEREMRERGDDLVREVMRLALDRAGPTAASLARVRDNVMAEVQRQRAARADAEPGDDAAPEGMGLREYPPGGWAPSQPEGAPPTPAAPVTLSKAVYKACAETYGFNPAEIRANLKIARDMAAHHAPDSAIIQRVARGSAA